VIEDLGERAGARTQDLLIKRSSFGLLIGASRCG
jgi:hypothetical protein